MKKQQSQREEGQRQLQSVVFTEFVKILQPTTEVIELWIDRHS